jgi:hypothetical protein
LQNVLLSANVASAGGKLQGTLTLTAPAPAAGLSVSLTSGTTAAIVPATVVVPLGNTSQTLEVDVDPLAAATAVTITASYAGVVRAASFSIGQLALSIGPASIPGGLTTTGTVSLPALAPDGGATIALASSSSKAGVPPSVVVPAGASFQTFAIATSDIAPTETAIISATYGGITRTATLTVVAYPVIVGVNCVPSSPSGGVAMLCTGTLAGPSPATGWRLTIASSDAAVTPVSPVTVAPAAQTFQFTLQTATVSATTLVTIQIFDSASGLTLWTAGLSIAP